MADVFTKAKRSDVMSRIRSRGNKGTELVLMSIFRRHRITGWRRHISLGLRVGRPRTRNARPNAASRRPARVRPDFVFRKLRVAVFVDGCFWHGCPKHGTRPGNNRAFWRKKFAHNQSRDRLVNRALRRAGWRVVRIWEHELRTPKRLLRRLQMARLLLISGG